MNDPRPEAVAAADWWTDRLADEPQHDVGSPISNAFAGVVADRTRKLRSLEEIEAFRATLTAAIEEHVSGADWRPEQPRWGSYFRSIGNDYGPDILLRKAAAQAGFKLGMLELPLKTVMWINPGEVKVAEGYGAEPVVIWPERRPQ